MKRIGVLLLLLVSVAVLAQEPKKVKRHDPPVYSSTVTLTSSQVDNLGVNPVQLVAAPSAGQFIQILSVVFEYKHGSAVFDITNGPDLNFMYGSDYSCPGGGFGAAVDGSFMTVPLSTVSIATPAIAPAAVSLFNTTYTDGFCPGIDGQPIYLYNAIGFGADFAGGGTSQLQVTTLYFLLND